VDLLTAAGRGVDRGGQGPCPPIVDWVDFWRKTGFVLSTRSVLWASNMPKMRWWPELRSGPRWGSSRRSPRTPSRSGKGGTSFQSTPFSCLQRSASVGSNVKSWLRPWQQGVPNPVVVPRALAGPTVLRRHTSSKIHAWTWCLWDYRQRWFWSSHIKLLPHTECDSSFRSNR